MKSFFVLTIIAAGICMGYAAVAKDIATKIKAAGQKCKEEHKLDDDTYNAWVKMHKVPQSDEGKCVVSCFMKEMGFINDDKFNLDEMKKANSHKWEDAAALEKANKAATECVEGASPDENKCEMAAKVMTCFFEKVAKEGIPLPLE